MFYILYQQWKIRVSVVIMSTMFFFADDGTYAMKKVLIQNSEQLELVREEIRVSSLFSHPNLLPLLDHAIISVKVVFLTINNCFAGVSNCSH